MNKIAFITTLLVLSFSLQGISQNFVVQDSYMQELNDMENIIVEKGTDRQGIDLINRANTTYQQLETGFRDNGMTLDFNNLDRTILKTYPNLKNLFKNYKSALKKKNSYFESNEEYQEAFKKVYPNINAKERKQKRRK